MAREEQAIFTVLCLLSDQNGNILLEDRKDPSWSGVSLPGGHVEPGESFTQAAVREMQEETGLTMKNPVLCGVKQFQTERNARYVVFLYKANQFSGTLTSSDEGEVFWANRNQLYEYNLVADFQELLDVFEKPDLNEFFYTKENVIPAKIFLILA